MSSTQLHNPVIYSDFPDPDIIRVGEDYYMVSTAMHFFPGAQLLHSRDLVHWGHCAYVYDTFGETAQQRMDDGLLYGRGMWAASLRHHAGRFYLLFTCNDTGHSYLYTAETPDHWTRQPLEGFYYDPSLFFDDDGRVYIAHGNRRIRLTEMRPDIIKIDRMFTANAMTHEFDYKQLMLFSEMVHSLNLSLCIEGTETKEEVQRVSTLVPEYIQGYYFGKPCAKDAFHEMIDKEISAEKERDC